MTDKETSAPREDTPNTQEGTAVGTPAGESYMDKVQQSVQETGQGPGGEEMSLNRDEETVSVDRSAVDLDAPEFNREPEQVKDDTVVFIPRKDFEARVNDKQFQFAKGVPHKVTHDVANMLLEDEDRGYIKE